MSLVEASATNLQDLIARVKRDGQSIAITSEGEEVAVLLSSEEWEDLQDSIAADQASAEWEADGRRTVPWEEVKRKAGLD
jgi:prevent-host-death family protein